MPYLTIDEAAELPGERDIESVMDDIDRVRRFLADVDDTDDASDVNGHMLALRSASETLRSLADDMYRVIYAAERRAEQEEEEEVCPECGASLDNLNADEYYSGYCSPRCEDRNN